MTILLDDRLADLDQPVRVMYGSKELIKTKVARTVTTLITTLVEYRDPELMFCGELQIQAPDGVAELEKRRLATAAEFAERAQDRIAVKRYDEAAADLEAALKLDPKPDAFAALKILGQIFSVQKDEAKLLDAEQRMADARPTDLPSQYIFAMQLMLTERKDLRNDQLALRYAERVLELSQPRNPQFMVAPALAYFRNGRKNDAINLIKEALAMLKPGEQSTLRAGLEKYLQEFSADAAATP